MIYHHCLWLSGGRIGMIAAALFMTFVTGARAAIINVPGNAATIQTAINQANIADEIVVWPGVHFENLKLTKSGITIRSLNPANPDVVAATIIDGSQTTCTLAIYDVTDFALRGLTLRRGRAEKGGGIFALRSQGLVANCTIELNSAIGKFGAGAQSTQATAGRGGAVAGEQARITMNDCLIRGNVAQGGEAQQSRPEKGLGGGIYAKLSTFNLTDCVLSTNTAVGGFDHAGTAANVYSGEGWGGAIYAEDSTASLTRTHCRLNIARGTLTTGRGHNGGSARGGAIYALRSFVSVASSAMFRNQVLGSNNQPYTTGGFGGPSAYGVNGAALGGGVYLENSNAALTQASVVGNVAQAVIGDPAALLAFQLGRGHGAGVYASGSTVAMINDTISSNTSNSEGGGIYSLNSTASVLNATVAMNMAPLHNGVVSTGTQGLSIKNTLFGLQNSPVSGVVTSLGHNLFTSAQPGIQVGTDVVAADAGVLYFATVTSGLVLNPLTPTSPAIDAGDSVGAPPVDERGVARPVGPAVDIGAIEYDGPLTDIVNAVRDGAWVAYE